MPDASHDASSPQQKQLELLRLTGSPDNQQPHRLYDAPYGAHKFLRSARKTI